VERITASGGISLACQVSGNPGAPPMVLLLVPAIIDAVDAGDPSAWAGLAAITAPALLVGGGQKSHVSQDKLAEAAGRIPRGELVTIDAGHHVHADRPEEFAAAVLAWLGAWALPPAG
jgi:3-oxoadipate enol-lactonase